MAKENYREEIFIFLISILALILFGCSENGTLEPKDKLMVGAIGTPTTDYYNFESLDYEQLSDEKIIKNYNAIFIFPSATEEIMKDIDKRRILRNITLPLVMIDQKDLVIGQLVQSSASNFSEYGNANGDIQFTYILRGGDNEKNYYNTTLDSQAGGYKILTDYLIIFNHYDNEADIDRKIREIT